MFIYGKMITEINKMSRWCTMPTFDSRDWLEIINRDIEIESKKHEYDLTKMGSSLVAVL